MGKINFAGSSKNPMTGQSVQKPKVNVKTLPPGTDIGQAAKDFYGTKPAAGLKPGDVIRQFGADAYGVGKSVLGGVGDFVSGAAGLIGGLPAPSGDLLGLTGAGPGGGFSYGARTGNVPPLFERNLGMDLNALQGTQYEGFGNFMQFGAGGYPMGLTPSQNQSVAAASASGAPPEVIQDMLEQAQKSNMARAVQKATDEIALMDKMLTRILSNIGQIG